MKFCFEINKPTRGLKDMKSMILLSLLFIAATTHTAAIAGALQCPPQSAKIHLCMDTGNPRTPGMVSPPKKMLVCYSSRDKSYRALFEDLKGNVLSFPARIERSEEGQTSYYVGNDPDAPLYYITMEPKSYPNDAFINRLIEGDFMWMTCKKSRSGI